MTADRESQTADPYKPMPVAATEGASADGGAVSGAAVVYTDQQIRVATFLGTPLAGGWMIWRNNVALGRTDTFFRDVGIALVLSLALVLIGFFAPVNLPRSVFAIAAAFAMGSLAPLLAPGAAIKRDGSIKRHSHWRMLGISIVSLVVALVVAVPLLLVFDPEFREAFRGE